MKQRMIICGVLVILIFAAHAPALRATFVWDDTALVLRDPLIRSWRLIPEGFQRFLFADATPSNFYRPVQRLSYTLEYWAFAFRPAPYHLTNILLHAATAIALLIFALAFLRLYQVDERKSLGVAAIASLAWALHPLHSGVVDYVAGRADSLAALFGFTALYFTVRALDRESTWKFYAVTGFALLASALSKESGLIFSALAITLILLRKNWKGIVPIGVAIAFVLTIYVTLRNQVPPVDVPRLSPPAPALVRPIIAARALAEYAGLLIAPANLHMDRDVENHPWGFNPVSLTAGAWRELETLAGLIVFGVLLWWARRAYQTSTGNLRASSLRRDFVFAGMRSFFLERKHCGTLGLRPVSLYSSRRCTASRVNRPDSDHFFLGHDVRGSLDRFSWGANILPRTRLAGPANVLHTHHRRRGRFRSDVD
jgi:hypothetical protein